VAHVLWTWGTDDRLSSAVLAGGPCPLDMGETMIYAQGYGLMIYCFGRSGPSMAGGPCPLDMGEPMIYAQGYAQASS